MYHMIVWEGFICNSGYHVIVWDGFISNSGYHVTCKMTMESLPLTCLGPLLFLFCLAFDASTLFTQAKLHPDFGHDPILNLTYFCCMRVVTQFWTWPICVACMWWPNFKPDLFCFACLWWPICEPDLFCCHNLKMTENFFYISLHKGIQSFSFPSEWSCQILRFFRSIVDLRI